MLFKFRFVLLQSISPVIYIDSSVSWFQHSFVIGGDTNRSITNMAVSSMGVWLALQNSAVLRLVHSLTYEILAEVNTALAVTKMLSSKCILCSFHRANGLNLTVRTNFLSYFTSSKRFVFTRFFLRLRRHYKATQSGVSSGHVVVGGQRPLVDRY